MSESSDDAETLLWERSHPSEDGEAMQQNTHATPKIDHKPDDVFYPLRWFVIYTICRHEKRVAQRLGHREIEYYLPLYRSERKWRDGSKVSLDLPLFPGYVFVHIKQSECVQVLNVPGTVAFVGGPGRGPAWISDLTIEALRCGVEQGLIEPHSLLTVGQRARIGSGAFAGMEGIVTRKKNGFRVVLTLEQMMQSVAVEVDGDDLIPLFPADFSSGASTLSTPACASKVA